LQLAVVNVTSAPVAEPPAFDIVAVKWYCVPHFRFCTCWEIPTFDVPEPTLSVLVLLILGEVPNWNDPDVELPFGFTVAFNTTDLRVTLVAAPVTTVGRHAVVLNVASLPRAVPPELVTTARKW
jgi:hypothetical protein